MATRPYRVRPGCRVNQDSVLRGPGEIVQLSDMQASDPEIAGRVEPVAPPPPPPPPPPAPAARPVPEQKE